MNSTLQPLETAILRTLAYADVFEYPLTEGEIHRYLMEVEAKREQVQAALVGASLARWLSSQEGYYTLAGRGELVEIRRRRAIVSARQLPKAIRYGRVIAGLPFVRMVAITGALAMENEAGDDMDYLIVTETGRLWLCRALVILLVRWAALRGNWICPNYLISERSLTFSERNLYTAHELAQMIPVSGLPIYRTIRLLNPWVQDFLPNAGGPPPQTPQWTASEPAMLQRLSEDALRTPAGAWLERWEMRRKIRKLSKQGVANPEADFCADWCKGHFGGYEQHTLADFSDRLKIMLDEHPS